MLKSFLYCVPLLLQLVPEDRHGPSAVLERGRGRVGEDSVQSLGGEDGEREDG